MAQVTEQISFLGSSVSQFTVNGGWNETASSLSLVLADDNNNPGFDSFIKPEPGSPVFFTTGLGFTFGGVIQKWSQKHSQTGNPIYDVTVTDPRPILEGVQIILANYQGTAFGLPNIINAFGHYERRGFGGSFANENGMPRYRVVPVVENFIITYSGSRYKVDLSNLPPSDNNYRITGDVISVLDLITQICSEGGCDYVMDLIEGGSDGIHTIKPRTIGRNTSSPPANQKILQFVNANIDDVADYTLGRELRAEPTTKLLIGGQVNETYQSRQLIPFWGFDSRGNPVTTSITNANFTVDVRQLGIRIIGENYAINVAEVRAALGSQETWETYMFAFKRPLAKRLGIIPTQNFTAMILVGEENPDDPKTSILDGYNFAAESVGRGDRLNDPENLIEQRIEKLYQFVNSLGQEFYGKQFLARIPFVARKIDGSSGQTTHSLEPTEAGWKESDFFGQGSLGISSFNEGIFKTQDGRLTAFVRFDIFNDIDTSHLSPANAVFENNRLFVKANIDSTIVFVKGVPAVIVNLSDPIVESTTIAPNLAGLDALADAGSEFLGINKETQLATMKAALEREGRSQGISMTGALRPLIPTLALIPLKDNRETYGPWAASQAGVSGAVQIEKDDSLTPWNFGNRSIMNISALSKLRNATAAQQVTEAGHVTLAGLPDKRIGDVLISGGPNLSQIEVSVGPNGLTTTYRMQTFTKRFGDFGKFRDEKLKRIGSRMNINEARIRRAFSSPPPPPFIPARAMGFDTMRNKGHKGHREVSTHAMETAEGQRDGDDDTDKKTHTVGSNTLPHQASQVSSAKPSKHKKTASSSKNATLRGFSTNPSGQFATDFPRFIEPGDDATTPTVRDLNPFKAGHDMLVTHGGSYKDISKTKEEDGYDENNVRPLGIRFPIVGVGWGYDSDDNPVPNKSETYPSQPSDEFADNYLNDTKQWKAGPVDMRWNEDRGVWVAGGDSVTIAVVIQQSGNFGDVANGLPKYICRPAGLSINFGGHPTLTFDSAGETEPLSSGTSDSIVFNMQEGRGDVHLINVGSPVLLYVKSGITFMSEHPRTLIRRTLTMPTQFS